MKGYLLAYLWGYLLAYSMGYVSPYQNWDFPLFYRFLSYRTVHQIP